MAHFLHRRTTRRPSSSFERPTLMALIKLGIAIAEMRGSVNGTTFARNRYGAYARNRTKPKDPLSERQAIVRNAMETLQTYWQNTLLDAGRQAWQDCAALTASTNALGDRITLTGSVLFIRTNMLRLLTAQVILATPPQGGALCDIPTLTWNCTTAAGLQVATVTPALSSGDRMILQASPPQLHTRNFFQGPWQHNGAFTNLWRFDSSDPLPFTILTPALLSVGNRFFIAMRRLSTTGSVSQTYYAIQDCLV